MIGILILGLFFIGLGIWFFISGRNSKGAEIWKILSVFLIIFGVALLFSPLIETLNSVSDTKSSTVYSPKGQSGETDLQKKRQEWRKRSEDAYQKGGYWRYD